MTEDEFDKSIERLIQKARFQGALSMVFCFLIGVAFSYFMNWISFVWK